MLSPGFPIIGSNSPAGIIFLRGRLSGESSHPDGAGGVKSPCLRGFRPPHPGELPEGGNSPRAAPRFQKDSGGSDTFGIHQPRTHSEVPSLQILLSQSQDFSLRPAQSKHIPPFPANPTCTPRPPSTPEQGLKPPSSSQPAAKHGQHNFNSKKLLFASSHFFFQVTKQLKAGRPTVPRTAPLPRGFVHGGNGVNPGVRRRVPGPIAHRTAGAGRQNPTYGAGRDVPLPDPPR